MDRRIELPDQFVVVHGRSRLTGADGASGDAVHRATPARPWWSTRLSEEHSGVEAGCVVLLRRNGCTELWRRPESCGGTESFGRTESCGRTELLGCATLRRDLLGWDLLRWALLGCPERGSGVRWQ